MNITFEDVPEFTDFHDLYKWVSNNVSETIAESMLAFTMSAYKKGLEDKDIGLT